MSELDRLIGSELISIKTDEGYTILEFDCGGLTAYNPVSFSQAATGQVVQAVKIENGLSLTIELLNSTSIEVSLKDEDYSGPEAFSVKFNDGAIVVV